MTTPLLPAYQLAANPYAKRKLDPVARPDDRKYLAQVDGWRGLGPLADFLADRAGQGPAHVVVSGVSGTGRTSFANELVDVWRGCGGDPDRSVLVCRADVSGHDGLSNLYRWTTSIRARARVDGKRAAPTGLLTQSTMDTLEALATQQPDSVVAAVQNALISVSNDLEMAGWSFAAVFEQVEEIRFVTAVQEAFDGIDALTVCTVDATASSREDLLHQLPTQLDDGSGRLVELRGIDGAEVDELVEVRWRAASPHDVPFDGSGVQQVFAKPRPLARVLRILELMLAEKHTHNRESGPWPEDKDKLYLDRDLLEQMLNRIESCLPGARP